MVQIKKWLEKVDRNLPFDFYELARAFYLQYAKIATPFFRIVAPLKARYLEKSRSDLKLHLGCGRVRKDGFVNIDLNKTIATDLVADVTSLPFGDDSVSRIENYHLIEHIPRCEVDCMLKEWFRVLEDKGTVVIECPDLDVNMENYLNDENKDTSLAYIFGSQRFPGDFHHWGYNFERLKNRLEEAGFSEVNEEEPQDYHKEEAPCLRVEAVK